jgi:hypothetical protein
MEQAIGQQKSAANVQWEMSSTQGRSDAWVKSKRQTWQSCATFMSR